MQTVITWTRYDGTPETLPEAGKNLLLVSIYYPCSVYLVSLDGPHEAPTWGGEQVFLDVKIGDLWAPWPDAPNGVE